MCKPRPSAAYEETWASAKWTVIKRREQAQRLGKELAEVEAELERVAAAEQVVAQLLAEQEDEAARRATTPAARLFLALVAIHAARPKALRHLRLDDVDLPNRRITINGHTRRLNEVTARLVADHLASRCERWPHTLNPHLFVNEQTGHDQRPMSEWWFNKQLRGLGVTVNQIRMDRQLEEALTHGPDPLHLAVVFGISERAALRYADADAARSFLMSHVDGPAKPPAGTPTA